MSGGNVLDSVRILVCIDLLFTVPLILAASRVIIEKHILDSDMGRNFDRMWSTYSQENEGTESELVHTHRFQSAPNLTCRFDGVEPQWINGASLSHGRDGIPHSNAGSSSCGESKDAVDIKIKTVQLGDFGHQTLATVSGEPDKGGRRGSSDSKLFTSAVQYTVRTALVTSVVLMSVSVPRFGDMVDLVGGLVMPLTCFLLPSAMNIRLWHHIDQLDTTTPTSLSPQKSAGGDVTLPVSAVSNSNSSPNSWSSSGVAPLIVKKKGSMSNAQLFVHTLIILFGLLTMIATTALTLSAN